MAGDRRYGRFTLRGISVLLRTPEVTRIMGSCSIIRVDHDQCSDVYTYLASSMHFDQVEPNAAAPRYDWCFSDDGRMWAVRSENCWHCGVSHKYVKDLEELAEEGYQAAMDMDTLS